MTYIRSEDVSVMTRRALPSIHDLLGIKGVPPVDVFSHSNVSSASFIVSFKVWDLIMIVSNSIRNRSKLLQVVFDGGISSQW